MWTIERTNTPRARVTGSPGATIAELAELIGLQPNESSAWFTSEVESGGVLLGEIPNTLVFLWAGDLGSLGKLAVGWSREMAYARQRGFHVAELDFRDGLTDYEVVERLGSYATHGELHGFVATGHGGPSGFGTGGITDKFHSNAWYFTYEELEASSPYHLAVVVLNACLSGYSRVDQAVRTARNFLVSRIDPSYELTTGGRDLVADSPTARFFGQCSILYPVLEGGRLRRLLRPGDHGTA